MFGKVFQSVEHAYQWRKAVFLGNRSIADRVFAAPTPRHAKLIADGELNTNGTNWCNERKAVMYDLLIEKSKQCEAFYRTLTQSQGEELVEDTNHEYWARGKHGQGQNTLGELLMIIRDGLMNGHSVSPMQEDIHYRPPANGAPHPCYQCGEGNHNSEKCRHQGFLKCRKCLYHGHKGKHCPDHF